MKKFTRFLLVLVLVLLAGLLVLNYKLGDIVKASAEKFGPVALKVPVKLESADFRLLRGYVELKGLQIGNPDGFKTPNAFSLDRIVVDLDPKSLFSDTIVIREILVEAPEVTYERGLRTSNLGALIDGMSPEKTDAEPAPEPEPEPASGKKVVIDRVLVSAGQINLSAGIMMGQAVPIPLPRVELKGIGREKEGASPVEAVVEIVKAIVGSAVSAAGAVVELAGDGVKAAGRMAGDAVGAAGSAAKATAGAVGDAAGATAGAIGDAAGAVGRGAGAAVGAAGDAAKGLVRGVGGLVGMGKDKPEQNEEEASADPDQDPASAK